VLVLVVLVLLAALSWAAIACIYVGWHAFMRELFTRWLAVTVSALALILAYVGYNVIARYTHWPVASGTIVADLVYGLLATLGVFGSVVFARETRKQRKALRARSTEEE
jgi:hypothetical protein